MGLKMWAVLLVLGLVCGSLVSGLRMEERDDGTGVMMKQVGASGMTCGQTVPVWFTAVADEHGQLATKVVFDGAASGSDSGAGFSDCLGVVATQSDKVGSLKMTQQRMGATFAKGSTLECSVFTTGLEKGETVEVMLEVRLACQRGSKPTGDLAMSVSDKATEKITLRAVENMNGAHSAHLGLVKSITTGDGICGMHDTEMLTESYLVDDRRQVKFCYRVVNYGTQPACGVSLEQHSGLDESSEYKVHMPSLGDDCTLGQYDALPGSTTSGRNTLMWSSASAEFMTEYPCGVTSVVPRATLRFAGGAATSATVRLNTANDCTGASNHVRLGGSASNKQVEVCDCVIVDSQFYFLDYVETVNSVDLCSVTEAVTGYRCLIDVVDLPVGAEVCVIDLVPRYVAVNRIRDNTLGVRDPNDLIGCQQINVQIIKPMSMTRFSTFV